MPEIAKRTGPDPAAINPTHFCQGAIGRLSQIVLITPFAFLEKFWIVVIKFSISLATSASGLPNPATKLENAPFIASKEPETVLSDSLRKFPSN